MADEDDFLSRWSRRKRAVEVEAPPVSEDDVPVMAEENGEEAEAEVLERLGLPVPESLKEGGHFTVFMQAGVPQFLRKRALRVLWRSNPVLANLDGLNDYDDDFNSPELTQKVLATGYQVGRGFVKKVLEDIAEDGESPGEDDLVDGSDADEKPVEIPYEIEPKPAPEVLALDDQDAASRPRRMRFST